MIGYRSNVNMEPFQIDAILAILDSYHAPRVVEFGSGYSSVFFAALGRHGKWLSVEHDPLWSDRVIVALRGVAEFNVELRPANREYFAMPPWQADVVIVDGLHRAECVAAAAVAGADTIILHDSQRYDVAVPHGYDHETIGQYGYADEMLIMRAQS